MPEGSPLVVSSLDDGPEPNPYFALVRQMKITSLKADEAIISREFLTELLMPMLKKIKFDVTFYRSHYQDLAEAEARGTVTDLHDHYMRFGYFENRLPSQVTVDGPFYARQYPDVAVAILENRTPSAQSHFEQIGFGEGRIPRKGWSFADLLQD